MSDRVAGLGKSVLYGVAFILVVSGCGSSIDKSETVTDAERTTEAQVEASGENMGFDPVSLSDLAYGGGASFLSLTAEEIAVQSELAIEGVVIDVRRSRLNTRDGRFPSASEIKASGLTELTVVTDVEIEVTRTIATGLGVAEPVSGETFIVTVGGGTYFVDLDAAQASSLELVKVVGGEEHPAYDEGESPETPDIEVEVPVEGAVRFAWGSSPSEIMAEGDRVVLFLTLLRIDGYQGAERFEYWTPVHPGGVFQQSPAGEWLAPGEVQSVDVDELARLMP